MGVLLSAVAVRSDDLDEVVDVLLSMLRGVGHRVEPVPGPHLTTDHNDVMCTSSGRGWVTLVPHYVVPPEKLAAELTRRLDTLASAVAIYEDVLWTHHLVDRGEDLDRFVNLPGYFGPGEYDESWAGDAALVADRVGVDVSALAPYFRQVSVRRAGSGWLPRPKAHRDDEHDLVDGWVVTDLWRRMGIRWPEATSRSTLRVPLGDDGTDALAVWLRGY